MNITVTVNGLPLNQYTQYIQPKTKLAPSSEELLRRSVRVHTSTSSFRNHSGARSSRGRIIYSAGAQ